MFFIVSIVMVNCVNVAKYCSVNRMLRATITIHTFAILSVTKRPSNMIVSNDLSHFVSVLVLSISQASKFLFSFSFVFLVVRYCRYVLVFCCNRVLFLSLLQCDGSSFGG